MVAAPSGPSRVLLEWCCGNDSLFGMPSTESKGCNVVRLTEPEDMTAEYRYNVAQSVVLSAPKSAMIFIWAALPCTGGSPWQNINHNLPGSMARIKMHWRLFESFWEKLVNCVRCLAKGERKWRLCIEMPCSCTYWRLPYVRLVCGRNEFRRSVFSWLCSRSQNHEG